MRGRGKGEWKEDETGRDECKFIKSEEGYEQRHVKRRWIEREGGREKVEKECMGYGGRNRK